MSDPRAQLHAIVHGQVQGVGYRFFVLDSAAMLGLRGWTRNLPDGTVEVVAEGEPEAMERLAMALHQGPRGAQVTAVDLEWRDSSHGFPDFRISH
jgi:acylphosphatase